MYWQRSHRRIFNHNPDMKMICLLRDPVDRAFSHWEIEYTRGAEFQSFETDIEKLTELTGKEFHG